MNNYLMIHSWAFRVGNVNSTENILAWVRELNKKICVDIKKINLSEDLVWSYHEISGEIANNNSTFFKITGFQQWRGNRLFYEQPIIVQNEIGYLGIICKEIDGVLNFLMQAKIEPGNINKIQISPTIQATKSNFMQKHGGKKPPYLDYFINASKYEIIVDQIQSEQSSRFLKKRNRNIIIKIDEDIPVLSSHKWMTLGQIKVLMKYDNLVNMDTRTVLSCIPFSQVMLSKQEKNIICRHFTEKEFYRSIFEGDGMNSMTEIYQYINNYKMFDESIIETIPLFDMKSWEMKDGEFVCKEEFPFKIVFCDISIEGREVKHWTQPLFEAVGMATFGLIMCDIDGVRKFLVKAYPEIGCFDKIELGPSVLLEATDDSSKYDEITTLFMDKLGNPSNVYHNVILSEEGGRFYHEQNRNIILKLPYAELPKLPNGYFLVDFKTLNTLVQVNNCLNIQLRNLLSLLEV
ncbi:oxidase EvaA [Hydrogenoanaerobacterium saccharovorans]|uniref:Oxidase EvaA n=1 Tax=Hydrogenoanaerobacterium saccharovorans TaxID=474960 RepID=A0A1H8EEW7_9FIRM|nr:NDP-hexose 2,3-dehydratase family protein [Hydrogenoanaerobacterium saccharovorans]RPF42149.1 oxidase EvaA [Hydrogenoanaerobacterium saccharovorans]SEN17920.1 oxidase EvaA [Hydrogenoanaerobacterium saccharovorans]